MIGWASIARACGIEGTRFLSSRRTPLGMEVALALIPPCTPSQLQAAAEMIAVAYGAARVRVHVDPLHADWVALSIDQRLGVGSVPYVHEWNPAGMPLDPLRPIPIGLDDDARLVALGLFGRHSLIAGNPGSGKSNALRVVLAGLAASRDVAVFGIDPKHVELTMWSPRLSGLVTGSDAEPAMVLIEQLLDEIQVRAMHLASIGSAKLNPSPQHPWIVLVIDEWAELGAASDSKQRQALASLLRRYVALGRAVGCTAVLATQRPTSDTIDVGTRALIDLRFAFKVGDRYQAEAILGPGSFDASILAASSPGRALWTDGGPARAVQAYEVSDGMVPGLVCAGLRPSATAFSRFQM